MTGIDDAVLVALEDDVSVALHSGEASGLAVLGYGEISLVLGAPALEARWACKRLPVFPDRAAAERFEKTFHRYCSTLEARGVQVVDTEVHHLPRPDGRVVVYCVQPVLAAGCMAVAMGRRDDPQFPEVLAAIVDAAFAVIDPTVGLDAQLSNWAWVDGRLVYFDLTTPMLRRADRTSELDTGVFLASLPWALRAPVRRFVLPDILERYHNARSTVMDLAANLIKERLDSWIPTVIELAAGRVEPAITEVEVRKDYASDARTWRALQAVRRYDRVWQRKVRRRDYPFLLPARIDR